MTTADVVTMPARFTPTPSSARSQRRQRERHRTSASICGTATLPSAARNTNVPQCARRRRREHQRHRAGSRRASRRTPGAEVFEQRQSGEAGEHDDHHLPVPLRRSRRSQIVSEREHEARRCEQGSVDGEIGIGLVSARRSPFIAAERIRWRRPLDRIIEWSPARPAAVRGGRHCGDALDPARTGGEILVANLSRRA